MVSEVHEWLAERLPPQTETRIVHGDYRLDNAIIDASGSLLAIVDWEIASLGDPLADIGLLFTYWAGAGEEAVGATVLPGFPTRRELVARYAERSGRDVTGLHWYIVFSYWKLACVAEGVHARYASGGGGGDQATLESLSTAAETMARRAYQAASAATALSS